MATAIFQNLGSQLGSYLGNNSQFWQAVGSYAGAALGSYIDDQIFGAQVTNEGPRLSEDKITTSTEGTPIARLWGRDRLSGQLIWRTRYRETVTEEEVGGKGGGSGVTNRTYVYTCSFAIGFCEGPASAVGRIWADGMLLDQAKYTFRFYPGSETQTPDPKIAAIEGDAPGYRGLCYIVFEDMPLADFGNRLPVITAEIFKPLGEADPDALENRVAAVTLIPGTGEFALSDEVHIKTLEGASVPENAHNGRGDADFVKAVDGLEAALPNVSAVSLVVSWFGDDLRCGSCTMGCKCKSTRFSKSASRTRSIGPRGRCGLGASADGGAIC